MGWVPTFHVHCMLGLAWLMGWGTTSFDIWFLYTYQGSRTPDRESQCIHPGHASFQWDAAHSGSQRSQCKIIQITMERRWSGKILLHYFSKTWNTGSPWGRHRHIYIKKAGSTRSPMAKTMTKKKQPIPKIIKGTQGVIQKYSGMKCLLPGAQAPWFHFCTPIKGLYYKSHWILRDQPSSMGTSVHCGAST